MELKIVYMIKHTGGYNEKITVSKNDKGTISILDSIIDNNPNIENVQKKEILYENT